MLSAVFFALAASWIAMRLLMLVAICAALLSRKEPITVGESAIILSAFIFGALIFAGLVV